MLKLPLPVMKSAILDHAEFQTFNQSATKCLADWRMKVNKQMGVAWI